MTKKEAPFTLGECYVCGKKLGMKLKLPQLKIFGRDAFAGTPMDKHLCPFCMKPYWKGYRDGASIGLGAFSKSMDLTIQRERKIISLEETLERLEDE